MPNSLVVAAAAATSAGGRSKSAAQMDSSTQIALMRRLSSCIYRLCQLDMRERTLEIAWWWRKGAVVMSSWRIWNIWLNSAGSWGASNYRCKFGNVRPMRTNSRTLPCNYLSVMYIFQELMSFIGLLQEIGINLLTAFNFNGALSKIVGGQPSWPRKMINRHVDVTKSILFALVLMYVHIRSCF